MDEEFVLDPVQINQQQQHPFRLEESVRVISGVVHRQWRSCNLDGKFLTNHELDEVIHEGEFVITINNV
jgi:hypothetical protein